MRAIAGVVLVLAWVVAVPQAQAGRYEHSGGDDVTWFTYAANAAERNNVRISYDGATLRLEDAGLRVYAGNTQGGSALDTVDEVRCLVVSLTEQPTWDCRYFPTPDEACDSGGFGVVVCRAAGLEQIRVLLGNADDTFAGTIAAGPAVTVLGEAGVDVLDGTGMQALFEGGAGADVFQGAGAFVDYSTAATPVTVTIDGVADDGPPREGDDVRPGVGGVRGSDLRDDLRGSDGGELLDGGGGEDRIDGRGGYDRIFGGAGADWLFGGFGRDSVAGGDGPDTIRVADDAADAFDCGFGVDQLERDALDTGEAARCELAYGALGG